MGSDTYFISDIHLGARYIADHKAHERIITDWLKSIKPTARRLYLLGDILDYWYEYREVVPRGYIRFFGALADLADSGVEITWLKGNHDIWIFDYLPNEIGFRLVDGSLTETIDGKRFFLEHGDGVGKIPTTYRLLRSTFRNHLCQRLFATIHPRWTVAFAHRWSSHSRLSGNDLSSTSSTIHDNDSLLEFARQHNLQGGNIDFFIFGHRHCIANKQIDNSDSRIILLGDAFRLFTYAKWDGNKLEIHHIDHPHKLTYK